MKAPDFPPKADQPWAEQSGPFVHFGICPHNTGLNVQEQNFKIKSQNHANGEKSYAKALGPSEIMQDEKRRLGATCRIRTDDLPLTRRLLYRLS